MANEMTPAVSCTHLVKRYDAVLAVDELDLEVRTGECFGLLGPNGAGKTTTIEILEGLLAPDGGDVEVLGLRWGRDDARLRPQLGIHLQETQLDDRLSVEETLRMFRSFYPSGRSVREILTLLGLESKRSSWVQHLSGGQRQRLAVGCALIGEPALLFLDEPTTGLDPQSRRQLWEILERFRREGGTILLTTHYMDEAQALCDRVAVVDHGRVIAQGTSAELIASLGAPHVVDVVMTGTDDGRPLERRLQALPGVEDVRGGGDRWSLRVTALHRALPALMALAVDDGRELTSIATHTATLEDVFVSLTGRHLRDG